MRWRHVPLVGLMFVIFQNCGSFEADDRAGIYPYQVRPDFFYDVKLLRVEEDELMRQRYVFDIVASLAEDVGAEISYRVNFSTLIMSAVCQSTQGTVRGNAKHFRTQCLLPVPDDLYIQLQLFGPQGQELVEEFRFRAP
jgi:hypothetical protein